MRKALLGLAMLAILAMAPSAMAGGHQEAEPKPGVEVRGGVLGARVIKCWDRDWSVIFVRRSTVGVRVWDYRLTVTDFCWDGTKITDLNSHISVGGPFVPLWDFCCTFTDEKRWNARWSFKRRIEGKFVWVGQGVGFTVTPEVWFKVNGKGGLQFNASA